jgi:5-methylcytosine-specific restriction endonuclease McrA
MVAAMTAAVAQTQPITLLNASYEVLSSRVTPQKAARLLALDKVTIEEEDPERQLMGVWNYPLVLKLKYYVRVAYEKLHGAPRVSKRGVLVRDKHTCAYCTAEANTIDHILPRSRGGKNLWENLVASCGPCNRKKGNRTPEEAHMKLLIKPYRPKRSDLQR